ncbi:MAG TPA: glycoside hydrolase family 15 protein [Steroidobacteraceae bacterium]|nr:glycoside hydrolase family 15 protein [Steroidobacteraceae bacterium]
MRIEDYGLIGNTITSALVGRDGSIDWLCLPTFDAGACFAALLGDARNGCWKIAPPGDGYIATRAYRERTAILETNFECERGSFTVIDFMPPPDTQRDRVDVIRMVRCDRGRVAVHSRLVMRFDYGHVIPWVQKCDVGIIAIAGPDAIQFQSEVELRGEDMTTRADFKLKAGEARAFCLTWFPSHLPVPKPLNAKRALRATERWWKRWTSQAEELDLWNEAVMRSLITLKAATFSPTGAILAAPTTSLPEQIGGERNWDYRYCWIRDSTLLLYALLVSGFQDEARDWRRWLLRAAAGEPSKLQIMYGLRGERRLTEWTIPWLAGYENSLPVRIGNAAHVQLQLDVYGELMDTLHVARRFKLGAPAEAWQLQKQLVAFVAQAWDKPDYGIWEVRGPPQHFTHSKVMSWVAIDRAIQSVEKFRLRGPVKEWRRLRNAIHADICENGYSRRKQCFTRIYGGEELDASLLLIAQCGLVEPDDPRFINTVEAIERELKVDGLVRRYRAHRLEDGVTGSDSAFLACSFWLVDALILINRYDDALALFEHLLELRNDLGLLAEEYDARARRQLGNFPQAFSHIALINSAHNLVSHRAPAKDRAK